MRITLTTLLVLLMLSSCGKKMTTERKEIPIAKIPTNSNIDSKEFKTKSGKVFVVTEEKPSASISKITVTPKGFTKVNKPLQMEESDPFDYALIADVNNDGFDELYIITRGASSGSYAEIFGFASNKDKSVAPIYVHELTDDQFVKFFPNYMGHDTFYIEDNKLMRKYKQFKKEDEQCCPTGEMKFLEYTLNLDEASWILKISN